MIIGRKISLTKINNSIRLCLKNSNQLSRPLNEQLKYAAYQPSKIENQSLNIIDSSQNRTLFNKNGYNKRFSMIFPPPNITGNLHLGHALTATIQDAIIRWKRKQGYEDVQWIFGTDHAGIATQVVVEKILQKKYGKTRHDFGRNEFLKQILKWKHEKSTSIIDDLKKMGTTFNWNREYFTLDQNLSNAVDEAFIRLFEKELIYRDKSLINWSCALESAISDIEVENLEITGATQISVPNYDKNVTVGVLTDFAYKIVDSDEEIVVSTTRPETMLGDTAVAVHPNDSRYSHLRNKDIFLHHPYRNENIPLIFDESVDPEFGTGAVKITPSHDKNDFEVAKIHNLRHIQVITENGCINKNFQKFAELSRFKAREEIINDLAELELLRGTKPKNMVLPICSRSKDIVEFMVKPQWFVKCDKLSKKALQAVKNGEIKIFPQSFEREWNRWLENCHNWCISRQLWWGHQIPAYKFSTRDKEIWIAAKSQDEAEIKFRAQHPQLTKYQVARDQDVLDTWFSSGILPFSVFKWPDNDEDLRKYFPLNLMETGHDILFFWVARMVMLSIELTGKVPFDEILLHGIICDSFGRKMSKSLGNVISPDQVINGASLDDLRKETEQSVEKGILSKSELEKCIEGQRKMFPNGIQECGVDALRFTLCAQNTKQHFINFDVNECVTNKFFLNKIWQATKYAINYAENKSIKIRDIKDVEMKNLSAMDLWILSRLGNTIKIVRQSNDENNFHHSTTALKNFLYNNFCDVYLETTKSNLKESQCGVSSASVLTLCLSIGLDLMEIFTPYLVNELNKYLPTNVIFDAEKYINDKLENEVNDFLNICSSIREAKSHMKLTKKHKLLIALYAKNREFENFLIENLRHMTHLTFSENIKIINDGLSFENEKFDMTLTANHICSFGIKLLENHENLKGKDDLIKQKKLIKLEEELLNMINIVSKDGYKEKAKEKVQQKHYEKINKLKLEIENMKQIIGK